MVTVPARLVGQAIAAAIDCPGECIFLEDDQPDDAGDPDIVDAELFDPSMDP